MKVWIFNHYAVGPGSSGGTRHYDLAKEMGKHGWQVTLFAASFEHQSRQERVFTEGNRAGKVRQEQVGDVRFVWLKTCAYVRNDWRRVWNMVGYSWRAFWAGLREQERPDVIIGSLMHPLAAVVGFLLAWIKGCTFYFEERDLWPQTLIDLGKVSERHPVVWLLQRLELFLYRKAKRIIVLFDKASEYVTAQGVAREKVLYLPNGVDLERYVVEEAKVGLEARVEAFFAQMEGKFVAVYVGSHGIANYLDPILEAAGLLQERYPNFHFLLVGNGPEKERLVRVKEEQGLDNVTFLPPLPKEQVPLILSKCDAGLISLPDAELYKWGISFNKLYDYMASTLPVVLLSKRPESTVERSGGGVNVVTPQEMGETLVQLAEKPLLAQEMAARGRAYVEEHHSWEKLSVKLGAVIGEDVVGRQDGIGRHKDGQEEVSQLSAEQEDAEQEDAEQEDAEQEDAGPVVAGQVEVRERALQNARRDRKRGLWFKTTCDHLFAFLLLILFLPIFFLIALLIKTTSRGPVFFKQERAGRDGQPFLIWKFRTMVVGAATQGDGYYTGAGDPRITRVGHYLRKWSLDELPQVMNILLGEMSFIGPRPTLLYQVEQYDDQQRKRLHMKPGITGWAQVNGRNALSWPERIVLDVWYVERWSLWLDLKILLKTVKVVFQREGVYAGKEKFVISNKKEPHC